MEIHSCDTSAQTFLMVPHLQLSRSRGLTVTHRICLQDLSAPPPRPGPLHTPLPLPLGLSRSPSALGHSSAGPGNATSQGSFGSSS